MMLRYLRQTYISGRCMPKKYSPSPAFRLIRTWVRYKSTEVVGGDDGSSLEFADWDRGGQTKGNTLTPLYASMKQLIEKNPGAVCLIQVGSFYELYFEQAEIYGMKLGLKVATRKTSNHNVPMAGFPVNQLQKFVKMLVQDIEVNVAIIDQYPSNKLDETSGIGDKLIHRKISRIVTPGTLVDESFLNYNQNNYLLAISLPSNCTKHPYDPDMPVGLSWIDLSVGDFYVQLTTLSEVISATSRISPSEIIMPREFMTEDLATWYPGFQDLKKYFLRFHKTVYSDLKLLFKSNVNAVRKVIENFNVREEAAMNMVLSYIHVNLPDRNPSLDLPTQYWNDKYLQMDSRTRDALELIERTSGTSGRNLTVGSLLNTIRRTTTPSGTRLLTEWIKSPILNLEEIRHRQQFVEFFLKNTSQSIVVDELLGNLGDFVRSAQRLALGTGDTVTHLKSISLGLKVTQQLKEHLENNKPSKFLELLDGFLLEFDVPIELADEIEGTFEQVDFVKPIDEIEEAYQEIKQFAIRKDRTEELLTAHDELQALRVQESEIFDKIKSQILEVDGKLGIKIKQQHGKFNDVIYITGRANLIDALNERFHSDIREKRKGSVLFKSKEWKYIQLEINQKLDIISEIERGIINDLRSKTIDKIIEIRKVNKLVDFLDITLSFSKLTKEFNLVRPEFLKSNQLLVDDGRHIVVESSLKNVSSNFISNHTLLTTRQKTWVITGPNMGGKSTFLRQNALIVILAQIGCYVPASSCKLGTVDRIFTRIGASDDLFNDLSTFMVEMIEVSNILKNATKHSLAIVDEVGRGTSGKEGLAIAYSTLVSLLQVNKCRALFATHFGSELDEMLSKDKIDKAKLGFWQTGVIASKEDISIVLDHRLRKGISEKSYAIEVAEAAGFPKHSLKLANKALKEYL